MSTTPDAGEAVHLVGQAEALADKGQVDKAVALLCDAVDRDPADERAWRLLAALKEEQARGRISRGKKSDAAEAYLELAEMSAARRQYGRARRACRAARAADPDRDGLAAAIAAHGRARLVAIGRAAGLALCSALLIILAAPPVGFWPLGFVAFAPLYLAVRSATSPGRAAAIGWLCYFAANFTGFLWSLALMERFAQVSPTTGTFYLIAACAYHALVGLLWAWGSWLLCRRARLSWYVVAPLVLAVVEATVPMIFPWQVGIVVWRAWPVTQIAELGGPVAVSALVVLVGVIAADAGRAALRRELPGRETRWAAAVVVAVICLGLVRAAHVASVRGNAPVLRVAVVQPNFGTTSIEARARFGQDYIRALRKATAKAGAAGADLVIWPESAFPFLLDRALEREYAPGHPWQLRAEYHGRLLFGALAHPFGESYVYNSAILVAADGRVAGMYEKNRLLIFGEYIPLADRFPQWAERMRERMPDWPAIRRGTEPSVLEDGDLRILPMICYEDVLPDYVHEAARGGNPNLLTTLANHAWFGDSAAAPQALALATFRSIETRRDLVRATMSGVTSYGDALGRVYFQGPLHDVRSDPARRPEIFIEDVRLIEMFALGPYTAPLFPYACALALAVLALAGWRRRARHGAEIDHPS